MVSREKPRQVQGSAAALLAPDAKRKSLPIWLARNGRWVREAPLSGAQRAWLDALGFKGAARKHVLLPGPDGALAGAVLGLGEAGAGDPIMDKPELALGLLASALPPACYHLADEFADPELAAIASGVTSRPRATSWRNSRRRAGSIMRASWLWWTRSGSGAISSTPPRTI